MGAGAGAGGGGDGIAGRACRLGRSAESRVPVAGLDIGYPAAAAAGLGGQEHSPGPKLRRWGGR